MNYDAESFMITEFEQNFEHKRHFQSQRQAVVGLYFTLVLAIPIVLDKVSQKHYQGLLLYLFFVVGLLVFFLLIMNRKYSTKLTRQINGIRNHFISKCQDPSVQSIFSPKYLDKNFPPYLNIKSDSTIIFLLVGFFNSLAVSLATYVLWSFVWQSLAVSVSSFCIHTIIVKYVLK